MNTTLARKLLTVLLCGGLLATTATAQARGDRDDYRGDRYSHQYKHHYKHDHKRHYRHDSRRWSDRRGYREKVIVHRGPPRYRETVIHHHYAPPYRSYGYGRYDPAITIGVDIPPIVIPLR